MIAVTGANGKLGRRVIRGVLSRMPATEIVGTVRNPAQARDLEALGVQLREGDYDRPDTMRAALSGAEKVLLISASEPGKRIPQHKAAVDAAIAEGVELLLYTSILKADSSMMGLAKEHLQTEEYIRASGVPFVFLRNGWYFENQTGSLKGQVDNGVIFGAADNGRFASAARNDYADAAAAVLVADGQENRVYELGGDVPYTLGELAAEAAKQSGKKVVYRDLPEAEYAQTLLGFGIPPAIAEMLADSDAGAARGELDTTSRDLNTLLGKPTTTLAEAVATALRG